MIPGSRRKQIIRKESRINLYLRGSTVYIIRRRSGIGRGLWFFPAMDIDADSPEGWVSAGDLTVRIHTYTKYREELRPWILLPGDQHAEPAAEGGEWTEIADLVDRPMPTSYRRIADELSDRLPSLV